MSHRLPSLLRCRGRGRAALPCALVLGLTLATAAPLSAIDQEYANEGAKSCLDCHGNARVMKILDTAHAKGDDPVTPAAQKSCESCHGPSKTHMQFPMQVENLHFGRKSTTPPKVQNRACLECHRDEKRKGFEASAHGFEDVVCSTCHAIHDPARIVPSEATVAETCTAAGCHQTVNDDANPASFSHAVGKPMDGKGELTCNSCHNPHGPLNSGRCVDCHPQTPEVLAKESETARRFHQVATERGTECIRCHEALSHPIKPLEMKKQQQERAEHARR